LQKVSYKKAITEVREVKMNKEQLKPCPFCDGEAKKVQTPGSYGGYHLTTIQCQTCHARTTSGDRWNIRTKNPANVILEHIITDGAEITFALKQVAQEILKETSCH
jgi:hypothetical protein